MNNVEKNRRVREFKNYFRDLKIDESELPALLALRPFEFEEIRFGNKIPSLKVLKRMSMLVKFENRMNNYFKIVVEHKDKSKDNKIFCFFEHAEYDAIHSYDENHTGCFDLFSVDFERCSLVQIEIVCVSADSDDELEKNLCSRLSLIYGFSQDEVSLYLTSHSCSEEEKYTLKHDSVTYKFFELTKHEVQYLNLEFKNNYKWFRVSSTVEDKTSNFFFYVNMSEISFAISNSLANTVREQFLSKFFNADINNLSEYDCLKNSSFYQYAIAC